MDKELLIEVKHLSRHYHGGRGGDSIAVNDISFSLKRGEVLGFLGPNGAGKSTTMKMLSGNLAPTHGSIKIAGIDLMDQPIAAKAKIGYLPDTPPLYKDLSVDEYLKYCAQLNQIDKAEIANALAVAKERCGLSAHGQRIINHLSKGYQQRVGIAQAIIHAPDIVILDEPTVGLDPIQMVEIRKLIKELGQLHSVLISSHILPEIQAICDNVQIIKQGQLVFHSSIAQLNQHIHSHILCVSCRHSIDTEKLLALNGVHAIREKTSQASLMNGSSKPLTKFSNKQWRVDCTLADDSHNARQEITDIAQEVIALAVQEKWGLYEIYTEKKSLEDIFMSLTRDANVSTHYVDNEKTGLSHD
jgi:ABC-2 type transport system ATP-binding protein